MWTLARSEPDVPGGPRRVLSAATTDRFDLHANDKPERACRLRISWKRILSVCMPVHSTESRVRIH